MLVVLGGVLVLLLPGDEPPPSPPPGPPIHRSGELTIYDDGPYDLDELNPVHRIELTEEVELVGASTEAERFFQAAEGVGMGRLPGPVEDTHRACLDLGLQPTFGLNSADFKVGIADIKVSDVFCVLTSEDRLSVLEVTNKVSDIDSSLTMRVTTYE